jgi:2'-5' RNA ligase
MTEREAIDDDWHRCFIALVPDAATRDALAALPIGSAARRVAVDQLHMTVAFLGSVAPSTGVILAQRLGSVLAPLAAQRAEPSEYWPSAAHPRLVVLPFAAGNGLAELEVRVRELVGSLGLPVDDHRPFRPHITLARFARSARPARGAGTGLGRAAPHVAAPAEQARLEVIPRFDTLTLYSSTLHAMAHATARWRRWRCRRLETQLGRFDDGVKPRRAEGSKARWRPRCQREGARVSTRSTEVDARAIDVRTLRYAAARSSARSISSTWSCSATSDSRCATLMMAVFGSFSVSNR